VTSQPGWHPDPVPPRPGQPAQLRYWDGTRWTEHTAPAQPPAASDHYAAPAYQGQYAAAPGDPALSDPAAYAATYAAAYAYSGPPSTPDGVPLAGWWWRVLALVIDWMIVITVISLVGLPWIRDIWHSYKDFLDELLDESANGGSSPDTAQFQRDIAGPARMISLVSLAVTFCYHVGFLMWKQATPGKLATGLRVRLRERPGRLPLRAVLLRWVGQFGVRVIGLVPIIGVLSTIYLLLDYLWPLWDANKQALHEKLPRTNVVRIR